MQRYCHGNLWTNSWGHICFLFFVFLDLGWRIIDVDFYHLVLYHHHFPPGFGDFFLFQFFLVDGILEYRETCKSQSTDDSNVTIRDIVYKSFPSALSPFSFTRIILNMTDLVHKVPEVQGGGWETITPHQNMQLWAEEKPLPSGEA